MCVKALLKILTVVFSLIFFLIGLALLVFGCIAQFGAQTVVKNFLVTYIEQLNQALKDTGVSIDINTIIGQIPDITGGASITMIIVGAIICIFGICGMIGVCCEIKVLLFVYAVFLAIFIVAELVLIITYYAAKPTFESHAKTYMQTTIDTKFTGYNNTNIETVLWNVIQSQLLCCGITNGTDFKNATSWTRSVTYSGSTYSPLWYPMSCCDKNKISNCLSSNHTTDAYASTGCWTKLDTMFTANMMYAALGTAGVVLIQIIILVFVVGLIRGKSKTESV